MEICTHTGNLNHQLNIIENQIDKTISDIGRLSSYRLGSTQMLTSIRNDKLSFLHLLKEKKALLVNLIE